MKIDKNITSPAFTFSLENFLHSTTNRVNYQLIITPKYSHIHELLT